MRFQNLFARPTYILALLLVLASCSKELSNEQGGPDAGGGGTGAEGKGVLDSIIVSDATGQSGTLKFYYDGSNRLTKVIGVIYGNPNLYLDSLVITRAADGKVLQFFRENDAGPVFGKFEYDGSGKIVKALLSENSSFTAITNTTTIGYSGNNVAWTKSVYTESFDILDVLSIDSTRFTFSGSNLTKQDYYLTDDAATPMQLVTISEFTYDNKSTPFAYNLESYLLQLATAISTNNPTKFVTRSAPPDNVSFTYNTSFSSYQADGRPLAAAATVEHSSSPGGPIPAESFKYYYRP